MPITICPHYGENIITDCAADEIKHKDKTCASCRDLGDAKIPCLMYAYCRYAGTVSDVDNKVIPDFLILDI